MMRPRDHWMFVAAHLLMVVLAVVFFVFALDAVLDYLIGS